MSIDGADVRSASSFTTRNELILVVCILLIHFRLFHLKYELHAQNFFCNDISLSLVLLIIFLNETFSGIEMRTDIDIDSALPTRSNNTLNNVLGNKT